MEKVDSDYEENITLLTRNVEKLTESISEGFSLFRNVLCARSGMPYMQPQYHSMYSPQSAAAYPTMMASSSQDSILD